MVLLKLTVFLAIPLSPIYLHSNMVLLKPTKYEEENDDEDLNLHSNMVLLKRQSKYNL